ncbi:DUF6252 family protein [Mucilaginibacter psychrotolerans]|uniref:Lipocalin-like domain-containing protein n=1 Tax=Mucilaginibacter psychrotolerans TaxID=1524096 RepID=A0A4Y8SHU7_9SPHI|nr:DUF6252 family protein [Mucilaginibacter psychrotolerans]TFF38261.1 hypothetical protein E2R66_09510 [Mucilaginibacter psychrotolerans]
MKKLTLLALIFLCLVTAACTKHNCCVPPPITPYIGADKNTVKWTGEATAEKQGTDTLLIIGSKTEERLIMRLKFTGEGIYTFQNTQAFYFTTIGGDVFTSEYIVDETAASTLTVTDYNETSRLASGTYSLTLKRNYPNPTSAYPQKVQFVNGMFHVYLPK